MRRDKRIAGEFDKDAIKAAVDEAIREILANPDWHVSEYNEVETYMLEVFAADWLGQYQTEEIISQFGLRLKDDEWTWEEIGRIFDDVANLLDKAIPLSHPKFNNLWLTFGHGEGSPDWGLQMLFEMKEVD